MNTLKQRHIMLAQPQPSNTQLLTTLETLGAQVITVPTMIITPTPCELPSPQDDLPVYAIITSQHAVASFAQVKSNRMHVMAMGPTTASALQQANITVDTIAPPPYGSKALLSLPLWPIQTPHHLWVFCGKDCGQQLQESLQTIKTQPSLISCYERAPSNAKLTDFWSPSTPLDAIICLSHDNLDALIDMAGDAIKPLQNTPITTVNRAMDQTAKKAGWSTTIPLPDPTPDTIVNTLSSFFHQH